MQYQSSMSSSALLTLPGQTGKVVNPPIPTATDLAYRARLE